MILEKNCTKCNKTKELSMFYTRKDSKDGHAKICKNCKNECVKLYCKNNPEKIKKLTKKYSEIKKYYHKKYNEKYYKLNKEKLQKQRKTHYKNNVEKEKEYKKIWLENNPDYNRRYYEINKEKIKEQNKKYGKVNKEQKVKYSKEYNKNNKDKNNKRKREYNKNRTKIDSLYKLKRNIRSLITQSFKTKKFAKKSKTYEILGCSYEEFKQHIESKFESWMNWENHGKYNGGFNYGWDIDHIKPLSSAKTEEDVIRLNRWDNFQPLCSHTNRNIKRDKLEYII